MSAEGFLGHHEKIPVKRLLQVGSAVDLQISKKLSPCLLVKICDEINLITRLYFKVVFSSTTFRLCRETKPFHPIRMGDYTLIVRAL